MDGKEWFKEAKFGMFVHFGLYSLLAGEYNNKRMDEVAEWIQSYFKIPNKEYEKLAEAFNPIYFDAEDIVLLAKQAGMKYIVVTSKHHEGFSMYRTHVSDFNVCDRTPFKRDIIAEFADACKKHDMKFGIYYSQATDWREPDGAPYNEYDSMHGMSGANTWDYPDREGRDYKNCFERKIKPQVEELLTNYGELCIMWFDSGHGIEEKYSRELYDLVKKHQPNCLVNSRIGRVGELGNAPYDFLESSDNQVGFENDLEVLCEVPATLNNTWGFNYYDDNWKSAEDIVKMKNKLNNQGINYLLNIGPDYLGRIPVPTREILEKVGELLNN